MAVTTSNHGQSVSSDAYSATLRVLGGFSLLDNNGQSIELKARKSRQLLAYLAVPSGQVRTREQLAALLWSDRQDEQARGSLRTALSGIRRAIGDDALIVEQGTVRLRSGYLDTDYENLKKLSSNDTHISKLGDFYSGEFLYGQEHDSELFMDWLRGLRGECSDVALRILEKNANRFLENGDNASAIDLMRESLTLEPLKEQTHRTIMKLYVANGEKAMALAQFRTCKEVLLYELDAGPDPETQALADSIALRDVSVAKELLDQVTLIPEESALFVSSASSLDKNMPSIAVLPFINMSGDAEQNYFADGITEDIIIDLSDVEALSVAAKSSSEMYRGAAVSPIRISEELGVKYILQGSVRKSGKNVRISALLIDAPSNRQIWAERYDRTLSNIFELQSEISLAIVTALKISLDLTAEDATKNHATTSGEAHQIYLHAKSIRQTRVQVDNELAYELFERAIFLDPNFALAHAGLAETEAIIAEQNQLGGDELDSVLSHALMHCEKALQIDPHLAEAYVARGRIFAADNNHEEAKKCYLKAIELKPKLAAAYAVLVTHYVDNEDDYELAFSNSKQAFSLNPINRYCIAILAIASALGRDEELHSYAAQVLKLSTRRVSLNPHDHDAVGLIAFTYYLLGDLDQARHWVNIVSAFEVDDTFFLYNMACLQANLGSIDKSLEFLERSLAHVQPSPNMKWIKSGDPDLEPLRKDPRFYELLARYES